MSYVDRFLTYAPLTDTLDVCGGDTVPSYIGAQMKHRAKNGDRAERKRIWRHPLAGERLFHIYRGYITIRKVWNQREHYEHVEPHDHAYLVYEYVTDTGMRYIDDGFRLMEKCSMADGSNVNEYISRKTGEPHHVEVRVGGDTKCDSYCPVSDFCPFAQAKKSDVCERQEEK